MSGPFTDLIFSSTPELNNLVAQAQRMNRFPINSNLLTHIWQDCKTGLFSKENLCLAALK